jgi:hypothetical protein
MKTESSRKDQINEGMGVQVKKYKVHLESRYGNVQNKKQIITIYPAMSISWQLQYWNNSPLKFFSRE